MTLKQLEEQLRQARSNGASDDTEVKLYIVRRNKLGSRIDGSWQIHDLGVALVEFQSRIAGPEVSAVALREA